MYINTGSWIGTSGTSTSSRPTGDLEVYLSIQVLQVLQLPHNLLETQKQIYQYRFLASYFRYFNYLTTYWRPRNRFINTGSWLGTSGTSTSQRPTGDLEVCISIQVPGQVLQVLQLTYDLLETQKQIYQYRFLARYIRYFNFLTIYSTTYCLEQTRRNWQKLPSKIFEVFVNSFSP